MSEIKLLNIPQNKMSAYKRRLACWMKVLLNFCRVTKLSRNYSLSLQNEKNHSLQLQVSEVKTSQQIVRTKPAGTNKQTAKLVTMLFNKSVKATCYFRQLVMWRRIAYVDEITRFTLPKISSVHTT